MECLGVFSSDLQILGCSDDVVIFFLIIGVPVYLSIPAGNGGTAGKLLLLCPVIGVGGTNGRIRVLVTETGVSILDSWAFLGVFSTFINFLSLTLVPACLYSCLVRIF